MPSSSSFSVALSLGLLVRGRRGLAQMLFYALEKGPKEKNDNNKTHNPGKLALSSEISQHAEKSVICVQQICVFDQA